MAVFIYRAKGATTAAPAMAGAISGTNHIHCMVPTRQITSKRGEITFQVKRYCILIYSSEKLLCLPWLVAIEVVLLFHVVHASTQCIIQLSSLI